MEYKKIVAVTGLSGLYEMVGSKGDGGVVRSLENGQSKFVSNRQHTFSHLESIEIYTKGDNVNLVDIFKAMQASSEARPDVNDAAAMKAYFEKVYPEMDMERVYNSDMKKMVKWLDVLEKSDVEIKLSEVPEEEAATEETEGEEDKPAKKSELYSFITGKATTAIGRRLMKNFKQQGIEITIEQWSVLYHLWKEDGISQQQICEMTFRDKPSITRLIDNLERLGLVRRVANTTDRRVNLVYITDAAKEMQERSMAIANETLNEALVGVTKGQVEIAKEVLQKVYDNLK